MHNNRRLACSQWVFVLLSRKFIHILCLCLSFMYRTPCTVPLPPSLGHTLSRLHSTQLLLHVSHLTSLLLPLVGRLQFAVFGLINSENAYRESDVALHVNSWQTCLGFGKQIACNLNHSTLLLDVGLAYSSFVSNNATPFLSSLLVPLIYLWISPSLQERHQF